MGLRGPAPEPTESKLARGNPGKRSLKKSEPRPKVKAPYCPPHLDSLAKKEWRRLVPILLEMRVLTEADYLSLANLCTATATLIRAQEQLAKTGILFKTPSGYIQQSPLVGIVNGQIEVVTRLAREFGLTPSARTRVHVQAEQKAELSTTAKLLALVAAQAAKR